MGFLSPLLFVSAAWLAVPLWLHLRRRRRQNPVEFPSLRYLKTAAARMKRQARVEDIGLLLLRLLLILLLAMAFARPVIRSHGSNWLGSRRAVESVIVIDATASMAWHGPNGSRIDEAKRLAREWIAGLDRTDAVALWVLTDQLERPVPLPITDRSHVDAQLDALQPSEGTSSLAPVFAAARDWADTRSAGRKELVIITDNQRAAWDWPADGFFRNRWKSSNTGLVVLTPDAKEAQNIAIDSVIWSQSVVSDGDMLNGVAKVVNYGPSKANDLLECHLTGGAVQRLPVEVPAGGTTDVSITMPVVGVTGPVMTGELSLSGDALSCDDHWYLALPIRKRTISLVVDREESLASGMRASHFLTRALVAGGAGTAEAIAVSDLKNHAMDGIDALWFTGGSVRNLADWNLALQFADRGGTVVVTGESQPDPQFPNWPVAAGDESSLPAGRMATRLLVASHPMFAGVWSERTPFPPLPQRIARHSEPSSAAKTLATLAGDYPLLVEQLKGKGRILWLNASLDRSWGDLPLSPVYVPLVQQIARAGELAMRTGTTGSVGEAWPSLTVFGDSVAWPTAADGKTTPRLPHSGVFDALDTSGNPVWRCAANVRRSESDLTTTNTATLQAMLPGRVVAGSSGLKDWRDGNHRDVPLWPWMLAAAALVYLLEWRISSITAKQRMPDLERPSLAHRDRRARA